MVSKDRMLELVGGIGVEEIKIEEPTPYVELRDLLGNVSISNISQINIERIEKLKSQLDGNWQEKGVDLWVSADLFLSAVRSVKTNSSLLMMERTKKRLLPDYVNEKFIDKFTQMIEDYRRRNGRNKVVTYEEFFRKTGLSKQNFSEFIRMSRGKFSFYEVKDEDGVDNIELIPFGYNSDIMRRVTVEELENERRKIIEEEKETEKEMVRIEKEE